MTRTTCDDGGSICPMVASAKLLGSMWALVVISYLSTGPKGFNELLRLVPQLNSKTLSRTLKSLQSKGLVNRTVISTQPFSVVYTLTPMSEELTPILVQLREWGAKWITSEGDRALVHRIAAASRQVRHPRGAMEGQGRNRHPR